MLRIFEAIKKSPFFNVNFDSHTISENASAEIGADAQQCKTPIIIPSCNISTQNCNLKKKDSP